MENLDISLELLVYCLIVFSLAWSWGLLERDKRTINAFNLSVVTRFTGALAFYLNLAFLIYSFFEFTLPNSLVPVGASIIGIGLGGAVDPLRRNAMVGSGNLVSLFAAAYFFHLSDLGGDWLHYAAWILLGAALVLLFGAFVGPSSKEVMERATDARMASEAALEQINKDIKEDIARSREQYEQDHKRERMRFLQEEVPEGYLFLTEVPVAFRHWLPSAPTTLKDQAFNERMVQGLRYLSVYLDIDFEDPYGGAIEVSYEVASRLYGTLDAYSVLPKSLWYPPQRGESWTIDQEQWVDIVEALERAIIRS